MRDVAALTLGLLVTTCALGDVVETTTRQSYAVHQAAGESMLSALNSASPVREAGKIYHAYTGWGVRWRFWWNTLPTGMCEISAVTTTLTVKMTLPDLRTSTQADSAKFARYFAALVQHEEGHRKIAKDAAYAVDKAILSHRPLPDCRLLEAAANRAAMDALERAAQVEKEYDRSTQFGCTQGACLGR